MPALPESDQTSNRTRLVRSSMCYSWRRHRKWRRHFASLSFADHLSPSWLQSIVMNIIIIRESRALGQRRGKKSDDRRIGERRSKYFASRTRRRRRAGREVNFSSSSCSADYQHSLCTRAHLSLLSRFIHCPIVVTLVKWTEDKLNSIESFRVLRFRSRETGLDTRSQSIFIWTMPLVSLPSSGLADVVNRRLVELWIEHNNGRAVYPSPSSRVCVQSFAFYWYLSHLDRQ